MRETVDPSSLCGGGDATERGAKAQISHSVPSRCMSEALLGVLPFGKGFAGIRAAAMAERKNAYRRGGRSPSLRGRRLQSYRSSWVWAALSDATVGEDIGV